MENSFNEEVLSEKLDKLVYWKQLVFLVSVCQRLLPSFIVFAKEAGVHGEDVLQNALDKAWNSLLDGEFLLDLSLQQELCESVAPDTEEFDSKYVSSALDAAIAISLLMKAFTINETNIIVEATTLIRDSVDMYVQEIENMDPNDPNLEKRILCHELMQNELKKQKEDILYLSKLENEQVPSMIDIKNKWFDRKDSCLGLVL